MAKKLFTLESEFDGKKFYLFKKGEVFSPENHLEIYREMRKSIRETEERHKNGTIIYLSRTEYNQLKQDPNYNIKE